MKLQPNEVCMHRIGSAPILNLNLKKKTENKIIEGQNSIHLENIQNFLWILGKLYRFAIGCTVVDSLTTVCKTSKTRRLRILLSWDISRVNLHVIMFSTHLYFRKCETSHVYPSPPHDAALAMQPSNTSPLLKHPSPCTHPKFLNANLGRRKSKKWFCLLHFQ